MVVFSEVSFPSFHSKSQKKLKQSSNLKKKTGLFGTPIINPPQTAVLGMYSIKKQPVWDEKSKSIQVHDTMYLALTFDHRFLNSFEILIENLHKFFLKFQNC